MRDKKTKILVGILLSLIVFTSSIAFLMYTKQSRISKNQEENVAVYVSVKDIKKGEMLNAENMLLANLPKSYIGAQALTQEEIMGRYAATDILKNEPFRIEKLTLQKPQDDKFTSSALDANSSGQKETEVQMLGSDTLSMAMDLFQNIDNSLKKGDYIDIVSVMPTRGADNEYEFSTKYIALHVQIGSITFPFIEAQDEKSKLKPVSVPGSLVLQMEPKEIKNFLKLYYTVQNINNNRVYNEQNKGHLWMIKCADNSNEEIQNYKKELTLDAQRNTKAVHTPQVKHLVNNHVSIVYEQ